MTRPKDTIPPARFNEKFGRLTPISFTTPKKHHWECLCDCGNRTLPYKYSLFCGNSTSCGKCKDITKRTYNFRDLTGLHFTYWTAKEYVGDSKWKCVCVCGVVSDIDSWELTHGQSRSCGCKRGEFMVRHGFATRDGNRISEYSTWAGIISRCTNPDNLAYARYGGRGISICDRWLKFENFLADMGMKPSREYTVERVDNNKGYSPDNCKWATRTEQAQNTRSNHLVTFNNETLCIEEWQRRLGLTNLSWRLKHWPLERAMTAPIAPSYLRRASYLLSCK